jgi:hypothetical protein
MWRLAFDYYRQENRVTAERMYGTAQQTITLVRLQFLCHIKPTEKQYMNKPQTSVRFHLQNLWNTQNIKITCPNQTQISPNRNILSKNSVNIDVEFHYSAMLFGFRMHEISAFYSYIYIVRKRTWGMVVQTY